MNRLYSTRARTLLTSACLVVAAAGLGLGVRTAFSMTSGGSCCFPGAPCCAHGAPGGVADAR
jgi:hypothetical protein